MFHSAEHVCVCLQGSVYKKADTAINTKARDEFWSKQEVPSSVKLCGVI